MWSLRLVKKGSRRHSGAAVSLWPVARWQAEPLQSSNITSGEEFCLQPMEDPMLEQATTPEEDRD